MRTKVLFSAKFIVLGAVFGIASCGVKKIEGARTGVEGILSSDAALESQTGVECSLVMEANPVKFGEAPTARVEFKGSAVVKSFWVNGREIALGGNVVALDPSDRYGNGKIALTVNLGKDRRVGCAVDYVIAPPPVFDGKAAPSVKATPAAKGVKPGETLRVSFEAIDVDPALFKLKSTQVRRLDRVDGDVPVPVPGAIDIGPLPLGNFDYVVLATLEPVSGSGKSFVSQSVFSFAVSEEVTPAMSVRPTSSSSSSSSSSSAASPSAAAAQATPTPAAGANSTPARPACSGVFDGKSCLETTTLYLCDKEVFPTAVGKWAIYWNYPPYILINGQSYKVCDGGDSGYSACYPYGGHTYCQTCKPRPPAPPVPTERIQLVTTNKSECTNNGYAVTGVRMMTLNNGDTDIIRWYKVERGVTMHYFLTSNENPGPPYVREGKVFSISTRKIEDLGAMDFRRCVKNVCKEATCLTNNQFNAFGLPCSTRFDSVDAGQLGWVWAPRDP